MKGKRLMRRVGFCLAVLLLFAIHPPTEPDAAAQMAMMETEPNDSRDEPQLIEFAQGEALVAEGVVAGDDEGSFVMELPRLENLLFAQVSADDPQEDWFAIEVEGELELAIELSWPVIEADLDSWMFNDISRAVYPDGLVTHHLAASDSNPEREPTGLEGEPAQYRILYTYSDRQAEVDEKPLAIPETSRYYLTVSNFDIGPTQSTPSTYRLNLTSPTPGATRTVVHDTSGPGQFAPVAPFDVEADTLLALQRITPPEYPARLDRVDLLQFDLGGQSQVGDPLKLIVLADPRGTGDPGQATEVLRRRVVLRELDAFNSYQLQDANVIIQSGDLYVGIEIVDRGDDLHLPFDLDKAGYGRTFVSTDGGETFGVLRTASLDVGVPLVSNVGIDAFLTINPTEVASAAAGRRQVARRETVDRATRKVKSISVEKLGLPPASAAGGDN